MNNRLAYQCAMRAVVVFCCLPSWGVVAGWRDLACCGWCAWGCWGRVSIIAMAVFKATTATRLAVSHKVAVVVRHCSFSGGTLLCVNVCM